MKRAVDLLIFDLDGTLVETRDDLARAVNHALRTLGRKELDVRTITGYVGSGVDKLLERSLAAYTQEEFERMRTAFRQYYAAHLVVYSQLYPGIQETLDYFADKKLAVLSNKVHDYTVRIVELLDTRAYFDLVLGAQPRFPNKPAPDSIRHILRTLDVAPQQAVIIGDTANDVLAGKAAGICTCAVTFGFRPRDELVSCGADYMIDHPGELMDLFH